jgi:hypothetical protein
MAYFVGSPDGQGGHDSLAEKIGEAGKNWANNYWRKADMAYVPFSLFSPFLLVERRTRC